jgi:hypothetical protein
LARAGIYAAALAGAPFHTIDYRSFQKHACAEQQRPTAKPLQPPNAIDLRLAAQNAAMSAEPRAFAAILTVLLHVLILFALVRVTASAIKPPPPPAGQETTPNKLYSAGEQAISVDISPGLATSGLACAGSTYIGVGVTAERGSERIILVGDDTPASRAGLRHDDVVLNPAVWQDAHRDGALLRVLIMREGVTMAVLLRVGRICIG